MTSKFKQKSSENAWQVVWMNDCMFVWTYRRNLCRAESCIWYKAAERCLWHKSGVN